ncbi:hypothetical protein, variant [Fonticula alba]|nr:hypothetical protein, variant [Fonticula alba]KCV69602.1 hypothetical protein, variant [Fonticula alba]|eukprot:XP_009496167.1 hypothetical protein, variant [Fonticula alba]
MSSSHHTSMSAAAGIAAAVPAQSGSAFVLPAPLQAVSTKFNRFLQSTEEIVDQVSRPIGKYLPYVARFLIVLTFLEDAIRLFMNWDEQMSYLISRRGFNGYFAMFFLTSNIMLQTLGSFIVIGFGKLAPVGVGSLFYGLVLQTFGYAIYSDLSMLSRTLSLCGGLCLLASEALDTRRGRNAKDTSRRNLYAGLPELDAFEPAAYLQVAGRLFYMSLIVALLFDIEMDLLGVLYAMFVTVMCGAVMVGFHARANAVLLVVILVVHNFTVNDYWSVSYYHVLRDTMMYSFYQTWSVIGGLLLLANLGAGEFSIDKMKKSR